MDTGTEEYTGYLDPTMAMGLRNAQRAQDSDFMRFQLDMKAELDELKAHLLGLELDDKGVWVPGEGKKPMINSVGANQILALITPRVSRIFSLSNHDESDIRIRSEEFVMDLTFMLCRHKEEYGIPSYQVMNAIIDLCDDVVHATLLKSYDGWEGDSLRKGYTKSETKIMNEEQPRNSFFRLPGIGR